MQDRTTDGGNGILSTGESVSVVHARRGDPRLVLRFILLLIGAVVAVGAGYVLATSADGVFADRLVALLPIVAIGFSVVAAISGFLAVRKTVSLQTELRRLSQSIEISLREFESRSTRDSASIGEINELVTRELHTIAEHMQARQADPASPSTAPAAGAGNVVAFGSPRRQRQAADASVMVEGGTAEEAFRAAIAGGEFEISLQPIVSIQRSIAVGFEVFAHLPVEGGSGVDVRRAPDSIDGAQRAAFERRLIIAAAEAGRRRVGSISEAIPLHVAISHLLLGNEQEVAAVFDMLALYPAIARSIVLSLPPSVVLKPDQYAAVVSRLAEAGVRIAVEGWPETEDSAGTIRRLGASMVKLSATRLLDRDKARRKLTPAATVIDYAAGEELTLIATEVATDEDVVSLIDLGIDFMCGERFSGPKRLKPEGNNRSARVAQSWD
jgi:EAL domain-containing protein (putative c-di-GMP-specific phosphodiesterase class I)